MDFSAHTFEEADQAWKCLDGPDYDPLPGLGHTLPPSPQDFLTPQGQVPAQKSTVPQDWSQADFSPATIHLAWASLQADLDADQHSDLVPHAYSRASFSEGPVRVASIDHSVPLDHSAQYDAEQLNHGLTGALQPSALMVPPQVPPSTMASSVDSCPQDIRRRRRRCLCCQLDKGNRPCLGYPLCQKCRIIPGIQAAPVTLADVSYIDWRLWFFLCRDLGENIAPFRQKYLTSSRLPAGALSPIILELEFDDRQSRRHISLTPTAVFQPVLTTEAFHVRLENSKVPVRAPAIYIPQLDKFVMKSMWGRACTSDSSQKLSADEKALFSAARLFTGYFSLLHSLGNTLINTDSTLDDSLGQFVFVELIYTFAFRLQMLFSEFAALCNTITQQNASKSHATIVLYALEVVYRVMLSMDSCAWDVPEHNPFHPLVRLWAGLKRRSSDFLSRILAFECYHSGADIEGQRMRLPSLVRFAREAKLKRLPCHLSVSAQRQRPMMFSFLMDPFPSLHSGHNKHFVVDLLVSAGTNFNLTIVEGSWKPRKRFPEYMVTEDNLKVLWTKFSVLRKDDASLDHSNVSVYGSSQSSVPSRSEIQSGSSLDKWTESSMSQVPDERDLPSLTRNSYTSFDTSHVGGSFEASSLNRSPHVVCELETGDDPLERLLAEQERRKNWRNYRDLRMPNNGGSTHDTKSDLRCPGEALDYSMVHRVKRKRSKENLNFGYQDHVLHDPKNPKVGQHEINLSLPYRKVPSCQPLKRQRSQEELSLAGMKDFDVLHVDKRPRTIDFSW